jgi:CRISPR type III-A-associated RAMP protein Csm4
MKELLIKIKFNDKFHIGMNALESNLNFMYADTFYSALSNEIIKLYGIEELEKFFNLTNDEKFIISDLFPMVDNVPYLPYPITYKYQE